MPKGSLRGTVNTTQSSALVLAEIFAFHKFLFLTGLCELTANVARVPYFFISKYDPPENRLGSVIFRLILTPFASMQTHFGFTCLNTYQ